MGFGRRAYRKRRDSLPAGEVIDRLACLPIWQNGVFGSLKLDETRVSTVGMPDRGQRHTKTDAGCRSKQRTEIGMPALYLPQPCSIYRCIVASAQLRQKDRGLHFTNCAVTPQLVGLAGLAFGR